MHDKTIVHIKMRFAAIVAALVMALGIGLVAAPTASAAKGDCPSGHGCSWNNNSYSGGEFVRFEFNVPNYGVWSGYDDSVSSAYSNGNNSSCAAAFFPAPNYLLTSYFFKFHPLRLGPGQSDSNLSNNRLYSYEGYTQQFWNDKISSARFVKTSNGTAC